LQDVSNLVSNNHTVSDIIKYNPLNNAGKLVYVANTGLRARKYNKTAFVDCSYCSKEKNFIYKHIIFIQFYYKIYNKFQDLIDYNKAKREQHPLLERRPGLITKSPLFPEKKHRVTNRIIYSIQRESSSTTRSTASKSSSSTTRSTANNGGSSTTSLTVNSSSSIDNSTKVAPHSDELPQTRRMDKDRIDDRDGFYEDKETQVESNWQYKSISNDSLDFLSKNYDKK
jgi:hypothetical protein